MDDIIYKFSAIMYIDAEVTVFDWSWVKKP
jgi:hypothetical protein